MGTKKKKKNINKMGIFPPTNIMMDRSKKQTQTSRRRMRIKHDKTIKVMSLDINQHRKAMQTATLTVGQSLLRG